MNRIGQKAGGAPAPASESPPGEWCVRVSLSVAEVVPAAILRNWIIVEGFARDHPSCWPSNRALADRLGVKVRAAQLVLEDLEDHGLVERKSPDGNRRFVVLIRRTAEPIAASEWRALADRAARRAEGRRALAAERKAERKAHKPKIRIVG